VTPKTDLAEHHISVLKLLAEGMTRDQVSLAMRFSKYSIDTTCQEIIAILGAVNMTNAVAIAYERGIMGHIRHHVPGTTYGVRWHSFTHVPMCDACREFDKAYRRGRRRVAHGEDPPFIRN
jgi:DNA-binding CsgD family transcriptional regulator